MSEQQKDQEHNESEFAKQAAQSRSGLFGDYWRFLRAEKKWWLLPILLALLAAGGFAVLAGTGVAPFLYTLF